MIASTKSKQAFFQHNSGFGDLEIIPQNMLIFNVQGAAYVFERLSEATVRLESDFFDFQRILG